MPMNPARYPPDWPEISDRIRWRAGNRCEWIDQDGQRCQARQGLPSPITGSRVVLTVAHLGIPTPDGSPGSHQDKMDCRPENLLCLCQFHHLNYDRPEAIKAAAEQRRRQQLAAGQLELPGFGYST